MKSLREIALLLAVVLTTLTAFLLPLKFGGIAGMIEVPGFYPPGVFDWLIVTWPAPLFPVVAGVLLLLTVLGGAWRLPQSKGQLAVTALWGAILPFVALFGVGNAASPGLNTAVGAHYLGVGAWCWCAGLLMRADPRNRERFFAALAWGTLLAALSGWHQYFWGFDETRRFFAEAAAKGGTALGEQLQIKLDDDRVYSTFSSCNNFAGFLLLAGAGATYCFFRLGDRFEPRKLSRRLFGGIVLVLTFGLIPLTRSRGALLCALAIGMAALFASRLSRKIKVAAAVAAAVVLLGGAWYVQHAGRGFSSSAERLDYLATVARITFAHPWAGAGWDGFFREHMRTKRSSTDEAAHDPHNFFASFNAATGLPGALIAFAVFAVPFCFLWRDRKKRDALGRCAAWGCVAFALHMLMEVDYLVPGALAAFTLLLLVALSPGETGERVETPKRDLASGIVAVLLALGALCSGVRTISADAALARFTTVVEPEPGLPWRPPTMERLDAALAEVQKHFPNAAFVLDKAADCCIAQGELARGEALLTDSLHAGGGPRPGTYWRLAELCERQGRRDEAKKYRLKAAELFPAKYLSKILPARQ